jgi:RNA-directed DNA polymerase
MTIDWTIKNLDLAISKLAARLGVDSQVICLAWQNRNNYHQVRVLSDTRHRARIVLNACADLKMVQQLLNKRIFKQITLSTACHGFVPGRSFRTFLLPHINSVEFLNLDFKDAFNQVKAWQVLNLLEEVLDDQDLSKLITLLVTYKGEVSQGVASSPFLFNIACRGLDEAILQLAAAKSLIYTRYGDDICLSSSKEVNLLDLGNTVIELCQWFGFRLNFKKIKYQLARIKVPVISGIIIEHGKFRISKREGLDNIRAMLDRACWDESISIEKVEGTLGMVRMIYRNHGYGKHYLPRRLQRPYFNFRKARGLKIKH